jgi:putative membrane protein
MRFLLASVAAAAMLAGCARNDAPPEPAAPVVDPSSPLAAPTYLTMAASGDQFEIQSSQLALQRASNPALRQFAQMLITDHSNMSAQLIAAAQGAGLTPPPPALSPEHAAMLQQLQSAPAASFDMAYRDAQIMAHQQALTLHQNYASGGDVPALRTVAGTAVPIIQGHLSSIQGMSLAPPPPPAPAYQPAPAPGERG